MKPLGIAAGEDGAGGVLRFSREGGCMAGREAVLALDLGTSGAKAALVTRDGQVVADVSAGYSTTTGPSGEVEQFPGDWWQASCDAVRRCLSRANARVVAIALTGQMQDLVLLSGGDVLGPALLYADQRAAVEAAAMLERVLPDDFVRVTANLADATSLPAKLLWLQRHRPEDARRVDRLLFGAHDYLSWRLTGRAVTDATTASTTGLLDFQAGAWSREILDRLGLRTDWLPEIWPSDQPVGELTKEVADQLGLEGGIPVLHGAGDAGCTTLGVGSGEPGSAYLYLGTSGWLALSASGRRGDPYAGIFTLRHPNPAWTILVGPMLTAAGCLEWARRAVLSSLEYGEVDSLVLSVPPGSDGLLFLPYLAGERSPFRDPHARGAFIGLSLGTQPGHLARSIMEGVAFGFRSIAEAMGFTEPAVPLVVAGGGARSRVWCQILADVLGCPVRRSDVFEDVAVRGAALLAARWLGWCPGWSWPQPASSDEIFEPVPGTRARYDQLYPVFRQLYPSLLTSFRHLREIRDSLS